VDTIEEHTAVGRHVAAAAGVNVETFRFYQARLVAEPTHPSALPASVAATQPRLVIGTRRDRYRFIAISGLASL
jgi:hypothetical protein